MPNLPGRATSILAVLSDFTSTRRRVPPEFDWLALVQRNRPGSETEAQRLQAARLTRVREEMHSWAERLALSTEHVEESALYAVVATPANMPQKQVLALALTIFWIYLLDDFLDNPELSPLIVEAYRSRHDAGTIVDASLSAILQPVAASVNRAPLQQAGQQLCLDRSLYVTAHTLPPMAVVLRRALRAVLAALETAWQGERWTWGQDVYRRHIVAQQLALCAATMRQELLWNAALACDGETPEAATLPSFAAYLRGGTRSIGMPAVAAVVASFDEQPWHAWRNGRTCVEVAGQLVRLTNDLHTYERDVEEGKVTSITIRLQALEAFSGGSNAPSPEVVRQAQAVVSQDVAQSLNAFAGSIHSVRSVPLHYFLRHVVAFALAIYGDGSRLA